MDELRHIMGEKGKLKLQPEGDGVKEDTILVHDKHSKQLTDFYPLDQPIHKA